MQTRQAHAVLFLWPKNTTLMGFISYSSRPLTLSNKLFIKTVFRDLDASLRKQKITTHVNGKILDQYSDFY